MQGSERQGRGRQGRKRSGEGKHLDNASHMSRASLAVAWGQTQHMERVFHPHPPNTSQEQQRDTVHDRHQRQLSINTIYTSLLAGNTTPPSGGANV